MTQLDLDLEAQAYIRSEGEFSRARVKAFLEMMMSRITGHNMHLLSFSDVTQRLRLKQSVYRGLQDIPLAQVVGSAGRYEDFTRHFLPRSADKRDKERWRNIYTLAATGKPFPPIDVYQIDQVYFVEDGNHRVSVARELGWKTIHARVTELPSSISLSPDVEPSDLLIKEECAYFLEKTALDQSRPESRTQIEFSELGSYKRLLRHIELHRYLMEKERGHRLADNDDDALKIAAADWYDTVFAPTIAAVRETDIIDKFPDRSASDLYIWLITHQRELRERYDLDKLEMPYEIGEFLHWVEQADAQYEALKQAE